MTQCNSHITCRLRCLWTSTKNNEYSALSIQHEHSSVRKSREKKCLFQGHLAAVLFQIIIHSIYLFKHYNKKTQRAWMFYNCSHVHCWPAQLSGKFSICALVFIDFLIAKGYLLILMRKKVCYDAVIHIVVASNQSWVQKSTSIH